VLRTFVIISLLLGGSFALTAFNVGYSRAGEKYISKQKEKRKSIRPGYYYGRPGSGGIRGGK
jgi:hypothetical protein